MRRRSAASLELRPARGADTGRVVELLALLGYRPEAAHVRRHLRAGLEPTAGFRYQVAVEGGRIVGFLALSWQPRLTHPGPVARITELVVEAGSRRAGVGRQLVARASELARAAGCGLLELTTALARANAQDFYRALGFERTSWRYALRLDRDG